MGYQPHRMPPFPPTLGESIRRWLRKRRERKLESRAAKLRAECNRLRDESEARTRYRDNPEAMYRRLQEAEDEILRLKARMAT